MSCDDDSALSTTSSDSDSEPDPKRREEFEGHEPYHCDALVWDTGLKIAERENSDERWVASEDPVDIRP